MTSKVSDAVAQCLESGRYSDLTIRCGTEREFKVHKIIVCPQSAYFAKAVGEERFKEGQTGVIQLPADDNVDAIKAMVDFFYKGGYECPGQKFFDVPSPTQPVETPKKNFCDAEDDLDTFHGFGRTVARKKASSRVYIAKTLPMKLPTSSFTFELNDKQHPLLFHLAVYEVADRIQQADLKRLAESRFERTAQGSWQHVQFVDAVRKVYDVAPPGTQGDWLRRVVLTVTAEHLKEIFTVVGFAAMLREVHEFSADLNAVLSGYDSLNYGRFDSSAMEKFQCQGCNSSFKITVPSVQQRMSCPVCTASFSMDRWREGWSE